MTTKLTPEEEAEARRNTERTGPSTFTGPEKETLRRIWATLDAARAELAVERAKVKRLRDALGSCSQTLHTALKIHGGEFCDPDQHADIVLSRAALKETE